MPGHEQFRRVAPQIPASVRSGALSVSWTDDGRAFLYRHEGRTYRYDVDARTAVEVDAAELDALRDAQRPRVERGRQFERAASPDGRRVAVYRDHNIWITDADGGNERQLTTEGNAAERIKYGTASWVYGEEPYQNTAMWWSPDGSKLAFYRFDESG